MTDSGNPPELATLEPLAPLEPLDAGGAAAGGAPAASADMATAMARASLAAPAFNPFCRDKTFYRFLFAGVLMVLGCLMPFGADYQMVGYKTMSGAVYLVIGVAMVWTWWGAIHNNRSTSASLKWLLLCALVMVAGIMGLVWYNPEVALAAAQQRGLLPADAQVSTWASLFPDLFAAGRPGEAAVVAGSRVENFWRLHGVGKFFVLIGSVIAEIGFFGGVLGGAKKNKQEKQSRMMAATERKRR
ncbi:MAG: hypothetical protein JNL08_17775 [Planctomycetes bacterium]|nr:hypothetical protein [Planctomycetota bacterium]